MSDDLLREIFSNYHSNQAKVGEIAAYLQSAINGFLNSSSGQDYQADPVEIKPSNRHSFVIESKQPDKDDTTSRMAVDVMAEGTVRVIASWAEQSSQVPDAVEKRYVHFTASEAPANIAAKALSAMSDMADNDLSFALRQFVETPEPEAGTSPHA